MTDSLHASELHLMRHVPPMQPPVHNAGQLAGTGGTGRTPHGPVPLHWADWHISEAAQTFEQLPQ